MGEKHYSSLGLSSSFYVVEESRGGDQPNGMERVRGRICYRISYSLKNGS